MSWFDPVGGGLTRRSVLLVLCAGASACGFQPLFRHSTDESADLTRIFHTIRISPISNRVGQQLHNALRDSLAPLGQPDRPLYRLDVSLSESRSDITIQRDTSPNLTKLRVTVHYKLIALPTGKTITGGRSESTTVFKIVNSEFANIAALSSARARTAMEISNQMRIQLGMFFRQAQRRPSDEASAQGS